MNFELTTTAPAREGDTLTMSSREIAELTGKRHDHVIRDIRNMLGTLGGAFPQFWGKEQTGGRPADVAHLPKRECLILVSGYSVELRAKIIDRWMELETAIVAAPPIQFDPTDPQVLLQVFGALSAKVEEQKVLIAAQEEDVAKLRRIEGAAGSMCITDAAKTLGVKRIELTSRMQANRWIYKRVGNASWLAYDAKRHAGYMEHKDHIYQDADGNERVATRALVTGKGLVKLAELLNRPLH